MGASGPFGGLDRRRFLTKAMAAGAVGALASWANPIIERAHAADPAGQGGLGDIEHFVLLMQENRSFDHYFGAFSGVRGFGEASTAWRQYGWTPGIGPAPDGFVNPFRLDTTRGPTLDGECVNDPDHSWGGMHRAWNGGANDRWMPMSIDSVGPANAPAAMGYHLREDIPIHHELADAFTLCDNYHCSVLGPTDPNRLYWIGATVDPDGAAGGPLVETPLLLPRHAYSWRTYPENLSEAGVDWKIYNNRDFGPLASVLLDGMIGCFTQSSDPNSNSRGAGQPRRTRTISRPTSPPTGCPPSPGWFRRCSPANIPRCPPRSALSASSSCSTSSPRIRRYGRRPRSS